MAQGYHDTGVGPFASTDTAESLSPRLSDVVVPSSLRQNLSRWSNRWRTSLMCSWICCCERRNAGAKREMSIESALWIVRTAPAAATGHGQIPSAGHAQPQFITDRLDVTH